MSPNTPTARLAPPIPNCSQKERKALEILHPKGVAVPESIKQNRHVLAMSMIEEAELFHHRELPRPQAVLKEILVNMRKVYQEAGIIHADLSPPI